jgi:hypothetical protein
MFMHLGKSLTIVIILSVLGNKNHFTAETTIETISGTTIRKILGSAGGKVIQTGGAAATLKLNGGGARNVLNASIFPDTDLNVEIAILRARTPARQPEGGNVSLH